MADDELSLGLFSPLTVGSDFWDAAREDVDAIIDHTELEEGARVLVIPRGAGQHAVAFAEQGMDVCAVGPDDDMLALADGRAKELDIEVDFVVENPEEYEPDNEFDIVVNLSSSFDFVQGAAVPGAALARIQQALRDEGWLVLRMMSMDRDQRRVKPRDWTETEGFLILEELEYDWEIGWVSFRWLIVSPDGRRYEFHLGHQGYDSKALAETVRDSGFEDVSIYGSLAAEPYASDTPLIIYARK